MNPALLSSASVEWMTPDWVIQRVSIELDLVLDVSARLETAQCEHFISPEEDGLKVSWTDRLETIRSSIAPDPHRPAAWWCNNPYGRGHGPKWAAKAIEEGRLSNGVLLVAARTETAWFRALARVGLVGFLPGRLFFLRPDGTGDAAPFPSALIWLGPKVWPGVRWLDWRDPSRSTRR